MNSTRQMLITVKILKNSGKFLFIIYIPNFILNMTNVYYLSEFEKKFLEIKLELISNKDDLEETIKLLNELIRATNSYNQIKNIFWNVSLL